MHIVGASRTNRKRQPHEADITQERGGCPRHHDRHLLGVEHSRSCIRESDDEIWYQTKEARRRLSIAIAEKWRQTSPRVPQGDHIDGNSRNLKCKLPTERARKSPHDKVKVADRSKAEPDQIATYGE